MIGKKELEQVREINRKLPFAHPIEQGVEPSERWFVVLREGGEVPAVGDKIRGWTEITDAVVSGSIKWLPGSETDPAAPLGSMFS